MDFDKKAIGERIKEYRLKRGFTQSDLAKEANITRIALGNYERGERIPTIDIFARIAVCQELTRRFDEPHFYFSYRSKMPELIKSMKDFKSKYDEDMMHWKTCPNLYIDDLFKLSGTVENGHLTSIDRDDLRIMFDIINARNLNHLTTLFSSEYSVKDITAIDAALGSRIFQMVTPYALGISGANQRLKGA